MDRFTLIMIAIAAGVGVCFLTLLVLLRRYISGTPFKENVSARGKIVVVTGANSGLGKQLALELNLRGAKVYMLCRSVQRGNEAAQDLVNNFKCDPSRLLVRQCDLCSFASVRKFVQNFESEEKCIDILFCNAGVMFLDEYERTEDGFETTLQANVLGHFLLIELLLHKLEAAQQGRIVLTSSILHRLTKGDKFSLEMMNSREHFTPSKMQVYSRTKLASILHAMELTKRLRERNPSTRVTVNALHPGYVRTNLIKSQSIIRKLLYPVNYFFSKNVVQGAQTSLFVALSPKLDRTSGKYFDDSKIATKHRLAHDESLARRFYDDCYRVVGLESQRVISSL